MKMKKIIKYGIIFAVVAFIFTSLIIFNFSLYDKPKTLEKVENISLFVDYNNGTIKSRENFTLEGGKTTAFDALIKWCKVTYEDYGWGIFVTSIDGVEGDWIYFVNNQSPSVGASVYPLKNNDVVKWQKL
ncbi:MAG: DUF4430 domain-containing protein [Promethearchaeota archaeon]